jgi:hypothetical protein
MGIQVNWDNAQHTVIREDYDPDWTWRDFEQAVADRKALLARHPHQIDVIISMMGQNDLPPNAMTRFRQAGESMPRNLGMTVIVGGGMITKFMIGTFSRIYPELNERFKIVDSLDEARAFLAARQQASR